jgi:hypothetical protein
MRIQCTVYVLTHSLGYQRAEKAEKKVKTLDQKLKDLRATSADLSDLDSGGGKAGGAAAGGGDMSVEALQWKIQTLEQVAYADVC